MRLFKSARLRHKALVQALAGLLQRKGMRVEVETGGPVDLVAFRDGGAPILVEVVAGGVSSMDVAKLAQAARRAGLEGARLYLVALGPVSRGAMMLARDLGVKLVKDLNDIVRDVEGHA